MVSTFSPCDGMRKRALWCPSVCLSVTLVHCIQMAENIVKLLVQSGSPITLVFLTPSAGTQFQGNPFSGGAKYTGVGIFFQFSSEITVYLGNDTRWDHALILPRVVSQIQFNFCVKKTILPPLPYLARHRNFTGVWQTGMSTVPAAPPIKYVLGYRSRTRSLTLTL